MTLVCRPWITLKNGKRLYAASKGKRAFCFYVDKVEPRKTKTVPTLTSSTAS